jgi:hypothetical protein
VKGFVVPGLFPFFTLYFAVCLLKFCGQILHFSYPEQRPGWATSGTGELLLTIVLFPISFLGELVLIYGLLILPWYLVLACAVAEMIVGGALHGLVFQPLTRRFGPFVAFMLALFIAVAVTIWYLYFDEEPVTIQLTLVGCIGIATVLLYRAVHMVRFLQKPEYVREHEEQERFQFWRRK